MKARSLMAWAFVGVLGVGPVLAASTVGTKQQESTAGCRNIIPGGCSLSCTQLQKNIAANDRADDGCATSSCSASYLENTLELRQQMDQNGCK